MKVNKSEGKLLTLVTMDLFQVDTNIEAYSHPFADVGEAERVSVGACVAVYDRSEEHSIPSADHSNVKEVAFDPKELRLIVKMEGWDLRDEIEQKCGNENTIRKTSSIIRMLAYTEQSAACFFMFHRR